MRRCRIWALLQLAADRAAVAVQSLRTREDRAAALALQRSLVPSALPTAAGVDVATRYVPGPAMSAATGMTCSSCPQDGWPWWCCLTGGTSPASHRRSGQHGVLAQIAADPPIGIATDPSRREVTTLTLDPGAVLCLYTDGLVERRDEPIDDGIIRLCQAVTPGPPEDVCVSAMQAMVGRRSPGDDIALLVLRWLPEQPATSATPARE